MDPFENNAEEFAARYIAIVESSQDAIICKDLRGIIVSWNPAAEDMFGYRASEVIGDSIQRLIPPERREEEERILEKIVRGECVRHFETVRVRKDGSAIEISITVAPIEDATGKIVGASKLARDVTGQKRAEASLRESEARFRTICEASPLGIILTDPNLNTIFANHAQEKICGFSAEEQAGQSWHAAIHPEDRERVIREWHELSQTGRAFRTERRYRHRNGKIVWASLIAAVIEDKAAVQGYVGIVEDITEQKRAEAALFESRERLSLALASARIASFDWDIVNDRRIWDENVHRLLGTDPRNFKGTTKEFFRVIHMEDRPLMQKALDSAIETGALEVEYRAVLPNGEIRHISSRGKVHYDSSGRAVRMTGVTWDITARKHAEEQIQTLNQELELRVVERTSELRAAVNALEAQISERRRLEREILEISEREKARVGQDLHDGLCQTLTGIGCLVRVLQRNVEEKKLAPDTISAKAGEIVDLLKDATNEARGLAAGMYPVNIEEYGLAPGLKKLAADTALRFRIACKFECTGSIVLVDNRAAAHVYRITQEAVSNAIRHGKAKLVLISLAAAGGWITLKIEDNGVGLLKDMEPTGMGLKTMNYRARSIGGSLEIRQHPQRGIEVICSFPNQQGPEGSNITGRGPARAKDFVTRLNAPSMRETRRRKPAR